MALNKLKKWVGTQLWSTYMTEYNDNVDATNAAIDLAETHMAENVSDNVHGLSSVLGNIVELTVVNGWSGFAGQPLRYVRIGNVGIVFGEIVRSDSSTANAVITTLPHSHAISRFSVSGHAAYIDGKNIRFEVAVPAGRKTILAMAEITS